MSMPHLLAGWLAKRQKPRWEILEQQVQWCPNPIHVLQELYRYLHWEKRSGLPPSEIIWEDDHLLLEDGLQFYADLGNRLGYPEWGALQNILENKAPVGFDEDLWSEVQAAHAGFQVGLVPLLSIPRHSHLRRLLIAMRCEVGQEEPSMLVKRPAVHPT